ncbi:hypothetical protein FGA82_17935 [Pseudomonas fluorescens]|uniref:hypothetical protein n=1 Tax=Pseudomonas fluorescens TaxID=294 RepID=UPI001130F84B|nr:hypothetical protein [Pseudomonas fluorescens]TMU77503.1 hypothetical protein FGA82_17935 [Pseudomonas fluorescens]
MTEPTRIEPRYPLALTLDQLNDLITRLDASAASESDPDAAVFALLDDVREARKQALSLTVRPVEMPVGGKA